MNNDGEQQKNKFSQATAQIDQTIQKYVQLTRYITFNHMFEHSRNRLDKMSLKLKPIKLDASDPRHDKYSFSNILKFNNQNQDASATFKYTPKNYEFVVDSIQHSQPITESLLIQNAILNNLLNRDKIENLKKKLNATLNPNLILK